MNKLISVSAAAALSLGAVGAHASIALPSSGSSDAILFAEVVNAAGTAAVASYAGDTGVSINSIIAQRIAIPEVLESDANLGKLFAADTVGDTLYFAVLGGQYTGSPNSPNFRTPGVAQLVTTVANNNTSALFAATTANLTHFGNGLNTDIGTINSNSGGANSIEGANPATSGVWDVTNGNGTAYWDGGSVSNGNDQSVTANLYYVTGGGGIASKVSTVFETTATLTASGLSLVTPLTPPMPLPPAVWLLGSGLLVLAGVARRARQAASASCAWPSRNRSNAAVVLIKSP